MTSSNPHSFQRPRLQIPSHRWLDWSVNLEMEPGWGGLAQTFSPYHSQTVLSYPQCFIVTLNNYKGYHFHCICKCYFYSKILKPPFEMCQV